MVFLAVTYGCESWTIKKAEHWRTDTFELWCWRWLLGVPWMARRSNQSILKEINPEYSLERLILKLKLQYFGHLMRRVDSLEKTLMLQRLRAEDRGNRGWDGWMASLTQWTWVWASSRNWWRTKKPGVLQSMGLQSWTQPSAWTIVTGRGNITPSFVVLKSSRKYKLHIHTIGWERVSPKNTRAQN